MGPKCTAKALRMRRMLLAEFNRSRFRAGNRTISAIQRPVHARFTPDSRPIGGDGLDCRCAFQGRFVAIRNWVAHPQGASVAGALRSRRRAPFNSTAILGLDRM